jgi:hypothetical protein
MWNPCPRFVHTFKLNNIYILLVSCKKRVKVSEMKFLLSPPEGAIFIKFLGNVKISAYYSEGMI